MPRPAAPLIAALLLTAAPSLAEGSPDAGLLSRRTVALLDIDAAAGAKDQAAGVGALVGSQLAARPELKVVTQADIVALLGIERQRQLLGQGDDGSDAGLGADGKCTESACMTEVSGAVGARYVVTLRLDRFGSRYLLSATLFDSQTATSLAKPTADAATEEALPDAAGTISRALLAGLGIEAAEPVASADAGTSGPAEQSGFLLGLKIGNSFLSGLQALNPGGDLELGYRLNERWSGSLQVGFTLGRGQGAAAGTVSIVPSQVTVRRSYRTDHSLRPYWGAGLGIQLELGNLGLIQSVGFLPSLFGSGGVQYFFGESFALALDGNVNAAQIILGAVDQRQGSGMNIDLSLGLSYRF